MRLGGADFEDSRQSFVEGRAEEKGKSSAKASGRAKGEAGA